MSTARALLFTILLLACGPSIAPLRRAEIDSALRASIEATLASGEWESGISGSTVSHWEKRRFVFPDRFELRSGFSQHGGGGEETSAPPQIGTFRITASGAVEHTLAGTTTRRTFVVAPDGHGGRVWTDIGYIAIGADRRRYRHESGRRSPTGRGWDVECEIDLPAKLDTLDSASCRMRVQIRARTLEGERETGAQALEVEGGCTIDRNGPLVRVSFEGFESVEPVQASSAWSNWLVRTGRRAADSDVAMNDAFRDGFVPVLAYDPANPDALFAAYVSGLALVVSP